MNYVIGDIHGELRKLEALLDIIVRKDSVPKFVFIGDYIDKGEDPRAVLSFLWQFSQSYDCTFLAGNHEYIWQRLDNSDEGEKYRAYLTKYGGLNTCASFGNKNFEDTRNEMLSHYEAFFNLLVPYAVCGNYFVCHSGVPASLFAASPNNIPLHDYLFNRYDFLNATSLYLDKYRVVFGHTAFYTPYVDDYKVGIDTGACFLESAALTAFCTDDETFINSFGQRVGISDIPRDRCPNIIRVKPRKML